MLSILIPTYNHDISALVRELQRQAKAWGGAFEIRCYDDGSREEIKAKNRPLNDLAGVIYRELPENLGRAEIRNLLAREAHYEALLFLDADSWPAQEDYVQRYMEQWDGKSVFCGGRVYREEPPQDPVLYLHWLYGRRREQKTAEERKRQPYHGFQTNNFMMPASVAQAVPFEGRLKQYGHEDTLFGKWLRERGVAVVHLDNPLEHTGLEPAEVFLRKHRQAVENLYQLYQDGIMLSTRLFNAYLNVYAWGIRKPILVLYRMSRKGIERNLRSARPSLLLFDFYRLGMLLSLEQEA